MAFYPATFVQDFDAKLNDHDLDGVLATFADDATVRLMPAPPPPELGVFSGRAQVRAFVEAFMPGLHVESENVDGTGDRITWTWTASGDRFRALGADPASGTAEAVLEGEKIKELTVTFSPDTLARMHADESGPARPP